MKVGRLCKKGKGGGGGGGGCERKKIRKKLIDFSFPKYNRQSGLISNF